MFFVLAVNYFYPLQQYRFFLRKFTKTLSVFVEIIHKDFYPKKYKYLHLHLLPHRLFVTQVKTPYLLRLPRHAIKAFFCMGDSRIN